MDSELVENCKQIVENWIRWADKQEGLCIQCRRPWHDGMCKCGGNKPLDVSLGLYMKSVEYAFVVLKEEKVKGINKL